LDWFFFQRAANYKFNKNAFNISSSVCHKFLLIDSAFDILADRLSPIIKMRHQ
jgi:hypothetical protein